MSSPIFCLESNRPIVGFIRPVPGSACVRTSNQSLAVALAAKSLTLPPGGEVRVVHIPTGEVVFVKAAEDGLVPARRQSH